MINYLEKTQLLKFTFCVNKLSNLHKESPIQEAAYVATKYSCLQH